MTGEETSGTISTTCTSVTTTVVNNSTIANGNVSNGGGNSGISFAVPLLEGLATHHIKQYQKTAFMSSCSNSIITAVVEEALEYEEAIMVIKRFMCSVVVPYVCMKRSRVATKAVSDEINNNVSCNIRFDSSTANNPSSAKAGLQATKKRSISTFDAIIDPTSSYLPPTRYSDPSSAVVNKKRKLSSQIVSKESSGLFSNHEEHWLWRSLRSYSTHERIAGTRLILMASSNSLSSGTSKTTMSGTNIRQNRRRTGKKFAIPSRTADQIVRLLNRHVVFFKEPERSLLNSRRKLENVSWKTKCPPARLAVEWIALLEHLWTNPAGHMYNQSGEIDSSKAIFELQNEDFLSDYFLKKSKKNWAWLTRTIWQCACECAKQIIHNRHHQSTGIAATAAAALAAFSHLAYILSIRRTVQVPVIKKDHRRRSSDEKKINTATKSSSHRYHIAKRDYGDNSATGNIGNLGVTTATVDGVDAPNTSATAESLSSQQRQTSLARDEVHIYNSTFLWGAVSDDDIVEDSEVGEENQLCPLACLIGAYFIAKEYCFTDPNSSVSACTSVGNVGSSNRSSCRMRNSTDAVPMSNWFASTTVEEQQSHHVNRANVSRRHHFELASPFGNTTGATVASTDDISPSSAIVESFVQRGGQNSSSPTAIFGSLARASQMLEQLICPLTECKVAVVNVTVAPNETEHQNQKVAEKNKRKKKLRILKKDDLTVRTKNSKDDSAKGTEKSATVSDSKSKQLKPETKDRRLKMETVDEEDSDEAEDICDNANDCRGEVDVGNDADKVTASGDDNRDCDDMRSYTIEGEDDNETEGEDDNENEFDDDDDDQEEGKERNDTAGSSVDRETLDIIEASRASLAEIATKEGNKILGDLLRNQRADNPKDKVHCENDVELENNILKDEAGIEDDIEGEDNDKNIDEDEEVVVHNEVEEDEASAIPDEDDDDDTFNASDVDLDDTEDQENQVDMDENDNDERMHDVEAEETAGNARNEENAAGDKLNKEVQNGDIGVDCDDDYDNAENDVDEDDDDAEDEDDEDDDDIDTESIEEGVLLVDPVGPVGDLHSRSNSQSLTQELLIRATAQNTASKEHDQEEVIPLLPNLDKRKVLYIKACMQLLVRHYPDNYTVHCNAGTLIVHRQAFLSHATEDILLGSINTAVKPPKKPLNIKIIMRRAPTQEEFFRGSLTRNPISLSSLSRGSGSGSSIQARTSSGNDQEEPTVADLRQHIANDLQMSDSAELIEVIVANKILDINLKLRVVHQVLWKNHLIDTSASSSSSVSAAASALFSSAGGPTSYMAAAGSAISMIFSTSSASDRGLGGGRVTKDTLASSLPPMVITYRLAGVDGEATEDIVRVGDLQDPEAPAETASDEEVEKLLEAEYGITRLVTEGRGIHALLRSVQNNVNEALRRIRRDDVGCENATANPSRIKFQQSRPCNGLALLRFCCRLPSNRKKLLQARAPTILLTLLLDVLRTLEDSSTTATRLQEATTIEAASKSNPTADILQQLIEVLTSDISWSGAEASDSTNKNDTDQGVASMHVLLQSIETISLSPPLRNVVANLLPFLTYGQPKLSRELANHFCTHIVIENLSDCENSINTGNESENLSTSHLDNNLKQRSIVLMNTFVQTALKLPTNPVCDILRTELLKCSFHEGLGRFLLRDIPSQPPPWTAALNSKEHESEELAKLEVAWRIYYSRRGLKMCFKMLTGICLKHRPTQLAISRFPFLLEACHWLESTSDSTALCVETKGIGLLAETLLDELKEENDEVTALIDCIRKKTRQRKKELAEIRRTRALRKVTSFGLSSKASRTTQALKQNILPPQLSFVSSSFDNSVSDSNNASHNTNEDHGAPISDSGKIHLSSENRGKNDLLDKFKSDEKPSWLMEAEMIEDESGLICAVCQEGRTLQPSELLGLYAYVTKVSIPIEQCGSRACIDGTNLFRSLPSILPEPLADTQMVEEWFVIAREAADQASLTSSNSITLSSNSGRRNSIFTTTVSAGNGIHITCHKLAKQADRSHPKAPKSEWEGASLRNNRCNCNVIMPLVSSRSSKVPLIAVDAALTDHQAAISNLLGSNPKSMLWTVLHDVRFLILRMAYGEALNADCGGGSVVSNCQLIYYQLLMADMFDQDAQVDQPEMSQHARGLSAALLAGCAILKSSDSAGASGSFSPLTRAVADAGPMAALTSILFHNCRPNDYKSDERDGAPEMLVPHPKRQWVVGNDLFLQSLLISAGRRHALGIDGSGCLNSRNRIGGRRPPSFADWDIVDNEEDCDISVGIAEESMDTQHELGFSRKRKRRSVANSGKPSIDDFQNVLRPMLTYYAIMNQLSSDFTVAADDVQILESAQKLEEVIQKCQRSRNIHELLQNGIFQCISMKHDEMIDLLQKGMVAAY